MSKWSTWQPLIILWTCNVHRMIAMCVNFSSSFLIFLKIQLICWWNVYPLFPESGVSSVHDNCHLMLGSCQLIIIVQLSTITPGDIQKGIEHWFFFNISWIHYTYYVIFHSKCVALTNIKVQFALILRKLRVILSSFS